MFMKRKQNQKTEYNVHLVQMPPWNKQGKTNTAAEFLLDLEVATDVIRHHH